MQFEYHLIISRARINAYFLFECVNFFTSYTVDIYASPSSEDAYSDRQLNLNFELRVETFCVHTCFHVRTPKPCLSVPRVSVPRENKSPWLRQYQSYISN